MGKATELINDANTRGIELYIDVGKLRYRSDLVPDPELLQELRNNRQAIIRELIGRQPKAWLDDQGRLRISGNGICPDRSLFETLICLGASVQEIEKHIGPIHHPGAWEMWTGEQTAFIPGRQKCA